MLTSSWYSTPHYKYLVPLYSGYLADEGEVSVDQQLAQAGIAPRITYT